MHSHRLGEHGVVDLAFGLWNLPRALLHLRQPEPALRLAAYAAAFWRERFGELSAADQRYLQRCGASRRANSMPGASTRCGARASRWRSPLP